MSVDEGRGVPRWATSLLATLGILAMAAAMWFSSRYETGLNGAARPCDRWATPCTPDQVTAMLRRTEWLWFGGAGLLLASLTGGLLARPHPDPDLQVHGSRPLARRLLTVALLGFPVYVIGVVASSLLGSLAPFTACALVLAAMIALASRLGCEVPVSRRVLAIGLMAVVALLAVPWMRQLGGLAERNPGAAWANVVGMVGWLGAWLLPAAGVLLAVRLLGADALGRPHPSEGDNRARV